MTVVTLTGSLLGMIFIVFPHPVILVAEKAIDVLSEFLRLIAGQISWTEFLLFLPLAIFVPPKSSLFMRILKEIQTKISALQ